MNVPMTALRGAIRFSLSRDTTIDDVVCVLNLLPDIIARLRALSPSEQESAPVAANSSRSPELTL
jgi:cysteine desulfurase